MKGLLIGLCMLLYAANGMAQHSTITNTAGNVDTTIADDMNKPDKAMALADIRRNTPILLLIGGFRPKQHPGTDSFEKKFNVRFWTYGCVFPEVENIIAYNNEIFKYLDKKYGKTWRKEVRPDVVGL